MKPYLACLLAAMLAPPLCAADLPAWEFGKGAGGWVPLNDIEGLRVADGALRFRMTGPDPYLYTEGAPLPVDTEEVEGIEWRMKLGAGGLAQVYWITDVSPEWYGPDRKSVRCAAKGDGEWHTYRLRLNTHPGWKGRLTQLRLDPAELYVKPDGPVECAIEYVRLYPPDLKALCTTHLSRPIATAGAPFELHCRVFNDHVKPLAGARATLQLPEGVSLAGGVLAQRFEDATPGRPASVAWRLVARDPEVYPLSVEVDLGAGGLRTLRRAIPVSGPLPPVPAGRPAGVECSASAGSVVLGNDQLRIDFLRNPWGFGRVAYYCRDSRSGAWRLMAVSRSLARLVVGKEPDEHEIAVRACRLLRGPGASRGVHFATTVAGTDGTRWSLAFEYRLAPGSDCVEVTHTAVPDRPASLWLFEGPTLHAGEGSFGSAKESALFPGLEFLQGAQESSSRRDFSNHWRFRMAPHPYRITVPLVSVSSGRQVVGLLWDALHKWDGVHACMGARFASPNAVPDCKTWFDQGDHHLMGLFVPSVPEWVDENGEQASRPYSARAGVPLQIAGRILVGESDDPSYALTRWICLYGLPEPAAPPQPLAKKRELIRSAYTETFWSEERGGWKHLLEDKEHQPNAWVELLLRLDGRAGVPAETARALQARIARVAAARRPGPAGHDHTGSKIPYFLGTLEPAALEPLERAAKDAMQSQQPDGTWGYRLLPVIEEFRHAEPLGVPGMKSIYQTGANAWNVLRYYRITGDKGALASGLKALDALAKRELIIPQGSPFECPASSPYLWSSALAIDAFVEGYRATGRRSYLEEARYWARSGLQFLYLWNIPGVPLQRYATTGIYSSSYGDAANWIGRPVQWIGLLYAYSLQHLAALDRSFPWGKVAWGIVVSAMHQQATAAPRKGAYPDSVDGAGDVVGPGFKDSIPAWIEPDFILMNLLAREGSDPEVQIAVHGDVHVSSAAAIRSVRRAGELQVSLRYRAGETAGTTIAGVPRPAQVTWNARTLPERAAPLAPRPRGEPESPQAGDGWLFDAAKGMLFLKTRFPRPDGRLRVVPPRQAAHPVSSQ